MQHFAVAPTPWWVSPQLFCWAAVNLCLWFHNFSLSHFKTSANPSRAASRRQPACPPPLCLPLAAPFVPGELGRAVFEITPLGPAGVSLAQTQLGKIENVIAASRVTLPLSRGCVADMSPALPPSPMPHPTLPPPLQPSRRSLSGLALPFCCMFPLRRLCHP